MRDLTDAAPAASRQDDDMNHDQRAETGWEWEVQQLMLHGRDREAAELAVRHLRDDQANPTAPIRGEVFMGPLEQLDELEPLLGGIAAGITPADLDSPTPCADFTVRGVLGHLIGGATQFAAAFRGESAPEVPADVADDADVVARAGEALGGLMGAIRSPGALDRTVAAPFGEMPGEAFARFVVLDGLVHGWDLATATGQTYAPSAALVADADAFARQAIAPEMRDGDTFAAETPAPQDATTLLRLVAFSGRRV